MFVVVGCVLLFGVACLMFVSDSCVVCCVLVACVVGVVGCCFGVACWLLHCVGCCVLMVVCWLLLCGFVG